MEKDPRPFGVLDPAEWSRRELLFIQASLTLINKVKESEFF
jgi:hypothetical protein